MNTSRFTASALSFLADMICAARWFDTVPGGRILNRFSSDVSSLDNSLTWSLRQTLLYIASGISSIFIVGAVGKSFPSLFHFGSTQFTEMFPLKTEPWFLLPASILSVVYFTLSAIYTGTRRDLTKMVSTNRRLVRRFHTFLRLQSVSKPRCLFIFLQSVVLRFRRTSGWHRDCPGVFWVSSLLAFIRS